MGSQVRAEVETVKHTQCQIEMINKAERQSVPLCRAQCDRQVRADAGVDFGASCLGAGTGSNREKTISQWGE